MNREIVSYAYKLSKEGNETVTNWNQLMMKAEEEKNGSTENGTIPDEANNRMEKRETLEKQ